jgi:hypothetical protein
MKKPQNPKQLSLFKEDKKVEDVVDVKVIDINKYRRSEIEQSFNSLSDHLI